MHLDDNADAPNVNTGKPWSSIEVTDLERCMKSGFSVDQAADFLCRTPQEIRSKALELGLLR